MGIWRLQRWGVWVCAGMLLASLVWALWEAGFTFWPLLPRVIVPGALAIFALLLAPRFHPGSSSTGKRLSHTCAAVLASALLVFVVGLFRPHGEIHASAS